MSIVKIASFGYKIFVVLSSRQSIYNVGLLTQVTILVIRFQCWISLAILRRLSLSNCTTMQCAWQIQFSSDKVTYEEVRARTGQQSILNTLSGRRLRWLGHTIRMDHHTSSTILGSPRFQEGTWPAKDKLERHGQERFARNGTYLGRGGGGSSQRQEWCRSVAQYVHVDMGWIKSSQVKCYRCMLMYCYSCCDLFIGWILTI